MSSCSYTETCFPKPSDGGTVQTRVSLSESSRYSRPRGSESGGGWFGLKFLYRGGVPNTAQQNVQRGLDKVGKNWLQGASFGPLRNGPFWPPLEAFLGYSVGPSGGLVPKRGKIFFRSDFENQKPKITQKILGKFSKRNEPLKGPAQ